MGNEKDPVARGFDIPAYGQSTPSLGRVEFDQVQTPYAPSAATTFQSRPVPAKIPDLAKAGTTMVGDKRIITIEGVRYLPLSLAAWMGQASESTLRNWIGQRTKFNGKVIHTHQSPSKALYVSEESVDRIANRFIKWPSGDPAGPVAIGETDDLSGFLGMPDAARIIGVSARTMWLWASQSKAPSDKPLDVIKCIVSDYFFIREKNVRELKTLVPRSGLSRGRRVRPELKP